uniref:EFHB C-terminal EF-hand domain-containing protein n=1 Tax=Neogobius melanostomus TaxID=47308 RepID=A0A8C6WIK7_9GOBI
MIKLLHKTSLKVIFTFTVIGADITGFPTALFLYYERNLSGLRRVSDSVGPQTPPEVRRFRLSQQPEPGAIRVHHGKARDPDLASTLVHGVGTKSSSLLNPAKGSVFQDKLQELSEAVFGSRQRAPLGKSHTQRSGLPAQVDPHSTVFGVRNRLDVRELLNPPKSRAEVDREAQEAHELYVHSHNHYFVGERISRKYDLPHFRADGVFGLPTPHFNDGRSLARTLDWGAINHSKIITKPSGELIHCTEPGRFTRGPAPERSLVNAVRHHLKKVNFHFFRTLLQAFTHYDKVRPQSVSDVLESVSGTSLLPHFLNAFLTSTFFKGIQLYLHISWLSGFSNYTARRIITQMSFLTIFQQRLISSRVVKTQNPLFECVVPYTKALLRPEDLEPLEPGSSLRVPRTLTRTRGDPEGFSPSSALIGAVHDPTAGKDRSCCGVPSVRTDLPAPRLKRVSDRTNYGDTSTAAALLHPHVHAALGVHEEHFLSPRSRQEITELFRNIGVELPAPLLDEVWELAALRSATGEVCVESFRAALKEIKAM